MIQRSLARSNLPFPQNAIPSLHGTTKKHKETLDTAGKLLPVISACPMLLQNSTPVLWHTDLHMGNIYVSDDDHSQITCIIDWQHTCVPPLFTQVRWPILLDPPTGYQEGMKIPHLHPDFENFDADDKEIAKVENIQATCSKTYELATCSKNREACSAKWGLNTACRAFFVRLGNTWDDEILPLRECLLTLTRIWT